MHSEKQIEYILYEHGGLSVLIPKYMRVKYDAPRFHAIGRRGRATLVIQIDTSKNERDAWEQLLHGPFCGDELLESRIIRQGMIDSPYSGWERIVENCLRLTPNDPSYGWGLELHPPGNRFIEVQAGEFTDWETFERRWRPVIESIRLIPDPLERECGPLAP